MATPNTQARVNAAMREVMANGYGDTVDEVIEDLFEEASVAGCDLCGRTDEHSHPAEEYGDFWAVQWYNDDI